MIVLGFDTATRSTAVGLRLPDGSALQARDDPSPTHPTGDDRNQIPPAHTTRLLGMADELLTQGAIGWSALERIAVGLGPGTFTGLRVGVATARGLSQTLGIELVGVSSLRALAEGARADIAGGTDPVGGQADTSSQGMMGVMAVIDARRGEAFVAAYEITDRGSVDEIFSPRALAPEGLGSVLAQAEAQRGAEHRGGWRAVGDGAVRFRANLEGAGVAVPPDSSPLHLVSAETICDLGARAEAATSYEAIVPDYRRRPDAEIALEGARALAGGQSPMKSAQAGGDG
jgi:tRNA threonylcarbamoyladenosine biosynthesis protein TsaB